jgi:phosphatidylserine decarboxylase
VAPAEHSSHPAAHRPQPAEHQLSSPRWRPLSEGAALLLPLAAASAAAAKFAPILAPIPLVLGGAIALAFRDPERTIHQRDDAALSPADGHVLRVAREFDDYWQQEMTEIAIFLALQDVHVQRMPLAGEVVAQVRKAGGYKPAMTEAATHGNNQLATYLQTAVGPCTVTQISGLVARRIVTWSQVGDHVEQGERLGMIKFGSQVTLRLPTSANVLVHAKERVTGGVTVMAEF